MSLQLKKATKENIKLRLALLGVAGAGKTYSALNIAKYLVPGGKVLLLDSEHGSAKKYADVFDFYHADVDDYNPRNYMQLIEQAEKLGVDVLIIDSMSHAWQWLVDFANSHKAGGPYGGWDKASPIQRAFVETILACRMHVIATMRQKSEYVVEQNERGKQAPKKIGMKAEQREGIDFEFDIVGEFDRDDHTMKITKSRCIALDNQSFYLPGAVFAEKVNEWLSSSPPPAPREPEPAQPQPPEKAPEKAIDGSRLVTGPEVGKGLAVCKANGWDGPKLTSYAKQALTKLTVAEFKAVLAFACANVWEPKHAE